MGDYADHIRVSSAHLQDVHCIVQPFSVQSAEAFIHKQSLYPSAPLGLHKNCLNLIKKK